MVDTQSLFPELVVERAGLAWLASAGCFTRHGLDLAPASPTAERADYSEVILKRRRRDILLPRFISVDLRIPAAEAFIQERAP